MHVAELNRMGAQIILKEIKQKLREIQDLLLNLWQQI